MYRVSMKLGKAALVVLAAIVVGVAEVTSKPSVMLPPDTLLPAENSTDTAILRRRQSVSMEQDGSHERPAARVAMEYDSPPTLIPGTYAFLQAAPTCRDRPPEYASVSAECSSNSIELGDEDGSGGQIFDVQQPHKDVNAYTIAVAASRNGCSRKTWSYQACGGSQDPDLFFGNDGSGRQLFSFEPASFYSDGSPSDVYYVIARQRHGPAPGSCSAYLSTVEQECTSEKTSLTFADVKQDGSLVNLRAMWRLVFLSPPAGPDAPIGAPFVTSGTYTLSNLGGACYPAAVIPPNKIGQLDLDALVSSAVDGSGRQVFRVSLVPGTINTYTITTTSGRFGVGATVLGMQDCQNKGAAADLATLGYRDEYTGLQRWLITPGNFNPELGLYYLIGKGRSSCSNYLTLPQCGIPSPYARFSYASLGEPPATPRVLWKFQPAAVPAPLLQDGRYRIYMLARSTCSSYMSGNPCASEPAFEDERTYIGVWRVKLVQGLETYTIRTDERCYTRLGPDENGRGGFLPPIAKYLAGGIQAQFIQANNVVLTEVSNENNVSAAGRWKITSAANSASNVFNVQCTSTNAAAANFLSAQACGGTNMPDLFSVDDQSGRQQWQVFYEGP